MISPTQYLNVECGLLSKTLSLENINQYVVRQLYREIVRHFYESRKAPLYIADKISDLFSLGWSAEKTASAYSQDSLERQSLLAQKILDTNAPERVGFVQEYAEQIEAMCVKFPQMFGEEIKRGIPSVDITLYQALLKSDKMEYVIQL